MLDFDPDSLFEEIENSPELADSTGGEQRTYYRIDTYITAIQGNSARYDSTFDFAIGSSETGPFTGFYAKEGVKLLLIEELTNYNVATKSYYGARRMYAHDDQGVKLKDGDKVCESFNGFFPAPQHVGKELRNPLNGQIVKIAYNANGDAPTQEQLEKTCLSCPLSQGIEVNGKFRPAPCAETTVWVVYLLPQTVWQKTDRLVRGKPEYKEVAYPGGLASVKGSNLGVEQALKGRDPKFTKSGLTHDGRAFVGIKSSFRAKSEAVISSIPLELVNKRVLNSVAFLGYGDVAAMRNKRLAETDTHAWFALKPEPFAPVGRPEMAGDMSFGHLPTHPVFMYPVVNNNPNNTVKCPQFVVLDGKTEGFPAEVVGGVVYKEYVGLKTQFRVNGRKAELMGLDESNVDRLSRALLTSGSQGALQLSSGDSYDDDIPFEPPTATARRSATALDVPLDD